MKARMPQERKPTIPDYVTVRALGSGGFGTVWMVRDLTGHYCAMKVVRRLHHDPVNAFKREFSALKRYKPIADAHPGLLNVNHIGKTAEFMYYILPLADPIGSNTVSIGDYEAKTLGAVLKQRCRIGVEESVQLILPVLDGLSFLHKKQFIHRDIKPDNILFRHNKPVLADISLLESPRVDMTVIGTPGYMPEGGCKSFSDDLYAVGKTLYVMITGYAPERYPSAPSRLSNKSMELYRRGVNDIINKACSHKYKSAGQMADDLKDAVKGELLQTKNSPKKRQTSIRPSRTRKPTRTVQAEKLRELEARVNRLIQIRRRPSRQKSSKDTVIVFTKQLARQTGAMTGRSVTAAQDAVESGRDAVIEWAEYVKRKSKRLTRAGARNVSNTVDNLRQSKVVRTGRKAVSKLRNKSLTLAKRTYIKGRRKTRIAVKIVKRIPKRIQTSPTMVQVRRTTKRKIKRVRTAATKAGKKAVKSLKRVATNLRSFVSS